jgi:hypothetical protein
MTSYYPHYKKTDSDVDQNGRAVHTMLSLGKQMPSYITPNYVTCINDAQKLNMLQHVVGITQLLVVKTSISTHCPRKHANRVPPILCALTFCMFHIRRSERTQERAYWNNIETLDTAHKREVNVTEGNTKYETFVSKFYNQARPA